MFEQVLNSLIASGPATAVLGLATWSLWVQNKRERERHEVVEQTQREETARLIASENARHQAEEDGLRKDYVATLKQFAGAIKGDQHAG